MSRKIAQYELMQCDRSFCPKCEEKVALLAPETESFSEWPAFYLCPECGYVGQIGAGPVKETEKVGAVPEGALVVELPLIVVEED